MNNSRAASSLPFILLFSMIAFVFHFAWEYFQCSPFFRHIRNSHSLGAMISATSGDILMMWLVYLAMAARHRSLKWFQGRWNLASIFLIVGFSLVLAILVELWALRTERWAYTENNPLLPVIGVSILPLLQMALITPISMFGSKIILTNLARAKQNPQENI